MKYKVQEHKYTNLLKNIRKYFSEANNNIWDKRNKIKIISFDDKDITIKSFKIPHIINKVAYTFLRASKAERSYENSLKILDFVPKPIGYTEFTRFGVLYDSYFLCEQYHYDFTIREPLMNKDFQNKEIIFQQFAEFTYKLHQKGVEHLDYSPGNILIKEKSNIEYEFKIIDVNRMKFKKFTKEERLQNFSKLWADDEDLIQIIKAYSPLIEMNAKQAVALALEASHKHKENKHLKQKMLKPLKKNKPTVKNTKNFIYSNVSVVIIAKNASKTVNESLMSLVSFDEVILYLNDSIDDTEEIASKYKNVNIITGSFVGFGLTKNKAADYAKHDWILSLDSDEILNSQFLVELNEHSLIESNKIFKFERDNYFLGRKTQDSDKILRMYNRTFTQFNDDNVHEKVMAPKGANIISIKKSFKHLNITNINQTLTKLIQYTDLGAEGKKICFFSIVIVKSLFAFFKVYVLKGNFMKGWIGIVLGINAANRRYYKYLKQFLNCQ